MKRLALYTATLLTVLGVTSTPSFADGFQYDVTVSSTLEVDSEGKLLGIRQVWDYAPEVTELMTDSLEVISDKTLDGLGRDMMNDLKRLGYFMELRLDGKELDHGTIDEYDILLPSEDNLQLTMFQPLVEPVDIKGHKLVIDMADPDGTGILKHASGSSIELPDSLKACRVDLQKTQDPSGENYVHGDPVQLVTIDCT